MVNLYKLLSGKGTLLAFLVGLIAIVIFFIPVLGGLDGFNSLPAADQKKSDIFNTGIYLMLFLLALSVIIALVWAVIQMLMNPSGAKMGFIWLAVIVGLFALGYFVLNKPDNAAILSDMKVNGVSDGQSKFIGGGIWLMLLMLFASVAIFIVSELRNLFK
jgi:hypothetical protein